MKYRLFLSSYLLLVLGVLDYTIVLADTTANAGGRAHDALLSAKEFPSAKDCATCHPQHYKEWAASPHAYAQLSPVFNAMHATLMKRTNGTVGDFCIRCHTPVGMELGEPIVESNLNRSEVSREGVTCVACHRRSKPFGKTSARVALSHGDIFSAVYGSKGSEELRRVISSGEYSITTEPETPGRKIHTDALKLDQITESSFCGTCHDVNSASGFRLEEAFSDYKSAPAAKQKISCQQCHMGPKPGVPSEYPVTSVAIVGGKPSKPRRHAIHSFVGPDYSIVHPGIFPHNPAAQRLASLAEWLEYDHEAGWGTDDFEDEVEDDFVFPSRWTSAADRYEARALLDENQELLSSIAEQRKELLQQGYQFGEIKVTRAEAEGIEFKAEVKNGTEGHSVPTGFDAERLVFLRVTVVDADGKVVFRSGDLDPNGDLRDSHSVYVHNGALEPDKFLFSLQSRFLVTLIRGGEREQVLNVNYSLSPLPFIRPPTNSTLLVGRPNAARKHRQSIPPGGSRTAYYRIEKEQLKGSQPPYRATIAIVAGMVPVNLVYEIQDVGFDYGMSPRQVADAVVAGHQVLWEREVDIALPATSTEGE